jgi:hypothetical protein
MIRGLLILSATALLAGCSTPYEEDRLPDTFEVCAQEAEKLRNIRKGMTESEVSRLMGPPYLRIFNGERYEHENRPHRREARKLANGWEVVVLYFRARVLHHDSVCTPDETEAVLLINGKVDTVIHGDTVDSFLSRF